MSWYSVRILFEIKYKRHEPLKHRLYSDSIFIVKAKNEKMAIKKVVNFARTNEEISYQNYLGETVTWNIKKIMDVHKIFEDQINEFTEIYSCFYRGWYPKKIYHSTSK